MWVMVADKTTDDNDDKATDDEHTSSSRTHYKTLSCHKKNPLFAMLASIADVMSRMTKEQKSKSLEIDDNTLRPPGKEDGR